MVQVSFAELVVQNIQNYGLTQYVLPFILLFAVVYGVMENANILSKRKNIQFIASFAMTALAILSPVGPGLANFLGIFLAKVGILMFSVLFGLMILLIGYRALAEFSGKDVHMGDSTSWIFWVTVVVVIIVFASSGGWDLLSISFNLPAIDGETVGYIFGIGIFVLILVFLWYSATRETREKRRRERIEHEKRSKALFGK